MSDGSCPLLASSPLHVQTTPAIRSVRCARAPVSCSQRSRNPASGTARINKPVAASLQACFSAALKSLVARSEACSAMSGRYRRFVCLVRSSLATRLSRAQSAVLRWEAAIFASAVPQAPAPSTATGPGWALAASMGKMRSTRYWRVMPGGRIKPDSLLAPAAPASCAACARRCSNRAWKFTSARCRGGKEVRVIASATFARK